MFYGKKGFVIFRGHTTRNHYRPELFKPVSALMEILRRINFDVGFASLYPAHRGLQATADHFLLTVLGRIHSLSKYFVPPEMYSYNKSQRDAKFLKFI
jgi:hypothetical protein